MVAPCVWSTLRYNNAEWGRRSCQTGKSGNRGTRKKKITQKWNEFWVESSCLMRVLPDFWRTLQGPSGKGSFGELQGTLRGEPSGSCGDLRGKCSNDKVQDISLVFVSFCEFLKECLRKPIYDDEQSVATKNSCVPMSRIAPACAKLRARKPSTTEGLRPATSSEITQWPHMFASIVVFRCLLFKRC